MSIRQLLLQDDSIRTLVEEIILEKNDRYDDLSNKWKGFCYEDAAQLLVCPTPGVLKLLFDYRKEKQELQVLEREIQSMCFMLNKVDGVIPVETNWEKMYNHARSVNIASVIGTILRKSDFRKNIICPFHKDKTSSFKVYVKNNRFVCFGCNKRGSPIDFIMEHEKCSFKEAIYYLSNF
jgi:hypothetical protein